MSEALPLIPLRDTVVFPHLVVPLLIGRSRSLSALEAAVSEHEQQVIVVAQKDSEQEDPLSKHLYRVGTRVQIHQVMRLPDHSVKALVEGVERVKLSRITTRQPHFMVTTAPLATQLPADGEVAVVHGALILENFARFVSGHPKIPETAYAAAQEIDDPEHLIDLIASFLPLSPTEKQDLLAIANLEERFLFVQCLLQQNLHRREIEQTIHNKVRDTLESTQKEYYLREQLRVIQTELGEDLNEVAELRQQLEQAHLEPHHWAKIDRELQRLEKMPPLTSEGAVIRNYLEWLAALPWQQLDPEAFDLAQAEQILDHDHYGLEKVKERILEFLAVRQLLATQAERRNPPAVLCLVGPPGVGKTSLAQSIARSLGRKLVRVSLGGVHDESEIRGHRRTYVGAMPGRILQALRDVGTRNPVMLLDEIDKLGASFQGDPAAALLEVLDPEQNSRFSDHFIDIPFDLSQVFFVCTANTDDTIPTPLLDRMEVVRLGGYTESEKVAIARRYLIPKQIRQNGLQTSSLDLQASALQRLIREYTREAGVRNLERTVGSLCRKVARQVLKDNSRQSNGSPDTSDPLGNSDNGNNGRVPETKNSHKSLRITARNVEKFLGNPPFLPDVPNTQSQIGICTGLAWTPYGGCTLPIEVNIMPGKGKLQLTGTLGEVMKESAQAAFSYIRAHREELHIPSSFPDQVDVHIHIPDGATPKDGPSAGIAMATALVSALTGRAVKHDVAMTGEITLRGRVLAIGGLKEKTLAASQMGIKQVLFPRSNLKDLSNVPDEVKRTVELIPVSFLAEVLAVALESERPALPLLWAMSDKHPAPHPQV